jgi:AcrR family transcriptional regulator
MPRPRSDDKRTAILAAATRIIVTQGLSAPTAGIAKEAGVANGSLFTYFATKSDLFNELYRELKLEMAAAILKDVPVGDDLREQVFHAWKNWADWALAFPEKRRALAQLGVSEEISASTRSAGHKGMAGVASGAMRKVPMGLVITLMTSVAEATIDFMAQDPANAKKHFKVGFEALWRMVA